MKSSAIFTALGIVVVILVSVMPFVSMNTSASVGQGCSTLTSYSTEYSISTYTTITVVTSTFTITTTTVVPTSTQTFYSTSCNSQSQVGVPEFPSAPSPILMLALIGIAFAGLTFAIRYAKLQLIKALFDKKSA